MLYSYTNMATVGVKGLKPSGEQRRSNAPFSVCQHENITRHDAAETGECDFRRDLLMQGATGDRLC